MNLEEQKLFDEFKTVLDLTQQHTFNTYIKPELDKYEELIRKQKRTQYILTSFIIFLLIVLTSFVYASSSTAIHLFFKNNF